MSLTLCLKDEDANVRKSASYAIGNATFHSGELYQQLSPSISELMSILDDPVAKTRANAAGTFALNTQSTSCTCQNSVNMYINTLNQPITSIICCASNFSIKLKKISLQLYLVPYDIYND